VRLGDRLPHDLCRIYVSHAQHGLDGQVVVVTDAGARVPTTQNRSLGVRKGMPFAS
jgi:hypothetical protein